MRTLTTNFNDDTTDRGDAFEWAQSVRRLSETLGTWRARARQRRALARLAPTFLRDIGIDDCDVWREVNKPFWRA